MSTSPTIDHCRTFATRCITEGLSSGLGSPKPGEMCIEALWCNVLGLPHSDDPQCVAYAVRSYKIGLNDASHADNKTRAECLVRLGVAQMGSKGVVDDGAFARRVTELTIREILPPVFRSVVDQIPSHAAYAAAAYAAAAAVHAARYARYAKRQDVLQHAANIGERVLRELGSPGIAWLDQLEAEGLVPAMREVTL